MLKTTRKCSEVLILKAMQHNITVIQVLDKVCNVSFQASDVYAPGLTARRLLTRGWECDILHTLLST